MEETTNDQIEWVESPDGIFEVYANMMHIMWTLDDVRIRIAQMVNSHETPNPGLGFRPIAQMSGAVTIPWRGAKILRDQLNGAIENYEATNGPIKIDLELPPSLA